MEVTCLSDIIQDDKDIVFEEALSRNKFSLKSWWSYIKAKAHAPAKFQDALYERALQCLPGSYKLWYSYLSTKVKRVMKRSISSSKYKIMNNTFERALVFMHKYPRIWITYLEFLMHQKKLTQTRRTFDRSLQSLPITQHERIWTLYIQFARDSGVWQTAVRVFRRYLQFDPSQREKYIEFLLAADDQHINEAAQQLAIVVNDPDFVSKKGKSKHKLWMELCNLISQHPQEVKDLKIEQIIRSGIRRFSDEVAHLWCALAEHFVRLSKFEKARDVYEEGIETVGTVRDFSVIFEAYSRFEDAMITAKMTMMEDGDEADMEADSADVDLRLMRLSYLMERRPILLSSVLLRQNPHNVHEWHNRVDIFKKLAEEDPARNKDVITTYTEAVKTVDHEKAIGKPHSLWVGFAKFYADHNDLANANVIFEKATQEEFRFVDDVAQVWSEWAEMLIKHNRAPKALELIRQATTVPPGRQQKAQKVYERVYKSKRLWSLLLDLEENLSPLADLRNAYDRCISLKVASAQMMLNFALILKRNKYFEESFKVYERAVSVFKWPHVKDVWLWYLQDFVERYGGTKLERARDLFEQVIEDVDEEGAMVFYLMYVKLEEKHGLIRHIMSILDRATTAVADKDKYSMFLFYINKAEEYYGATRTRAIFERAIEALPDEKLKDISMKFAEMERKLGEIDRARAIFMYASQFCDPRVVVSLWREWHKFEVQHGNEETFREMLRIKRSVQARYSQTNYMAAEMLTATPDVLSDAAAIKKDAAKQARLEGHNNPGSAATVARIKRKAGGIESEEASGMSALESQAARVNREVAQQEAQRAASSAPPASKRTRVEDVTEQEVPKAVFGGVGSSDPKEKPMGALERLKQKRAGQTKT